MPLFWARIFFFQAELNLLTLQCLPHLKRGDPVSHYSQTFLSSLSTTKENNNNKCLWGSKNIRRKLSKIRSNIWNCLWKRIWCFPYLLAWQCSCLLCLLSSPSVHNGKSMECLLMLSKQLYDKSVFLLELTKSSVLFPLLWHTEQNKGCRIKYSISNRPMLLKRYLVGLQWYTMVIFLSYCTLFCYPITIVGLSQCSIMDPNLKSKTNIEDIFVCMH